MSINRHANATATIYTSLCVALELCNAADLSKRCDDSNDLPSECASSHGLYGSIREALDTINPGAADHWDCNGEWPGLDFALHTAVADAEATADMLRSDLAGATAPDMMAEEGGPEYAAETRKLLDAAYYAIGVANAALAIEVAQREARAPTFMVPGSQPVLLCGAPFTPTPQRAAAVDLWAGLGHSERMATIEAEDLTGQFDADLETNGQCYGCDLSHDQCVC